MHIKSKFVLQTTSKFFICGYNLKFVFVNWWTSHMRFFCTYNTTQISNANLSWRCLICSNTIRCWRCHQLSCCGKFVILCLSCGGGVCLSTKPSACSVAKLHVPSGICNIRVVVDNLSFGGVCNRIVCYPKLLDMVCRVHATKWICGVTCSVAA